MNREVHVRFLEGAGLRCSALLDYLHADRDGREAQWQLAAYFNNYNRRRLHYSLCKTPPLGPCGAARAATLASLSSTDFLPPSASACATASPLNGEDSRDIESKIKSGKPMRYRV
jgi:hypothetical protein